MMAKKIGAVVAAAGLSSRMGDFKPLLPFDGDTVLGRCLDNLLRAGATETVVVTGHRADELAPVLASRPVRTVHNPDYAHTEMFDSLCLGLRALPPDCEKVLLTPGDVPWVSPGLIRALLAAEADFVCPRWGDRRGHPVSLAGENIPALLAYRGAGGLRGAVEALGLRTAFVDTEEAGITMDLDTPADYQKILKML